MHTIAYLVFLAFFTISTIDTGQGMKLVTLKVETISKKHLQITIQLLQAGSEKDIKNVDFENSTSSSK